MTENPEGVREQSEELDQLQPEETLDDRGVEDVLDEGYSPPEKWSSAEKFGNTAAEQAQGETLDQRLTQEEPDVGESGGADLAPEDLDLPAERDEFIDDGEVGNARAGRLVDPDGGIGEDIEKDLVGDDVGIDGAGASAEEAAVHIVDEDAADR